MERKSYPNPDCDAIVALVFRIFSKISFEVSYEQQNEPVFMEGRLTINRDRQESRDPDSSKSELTGSSSTSSTLLPYLHYPFSAVSNRTPVQKVSYKKVSRIIENTPNKMKCSRGTHYYGSSV